jgi:hypothetical protein
MLCHVALVRTDVSKDNCASIISVTRISALGTTLAVTSNCHSVRVFENRVLRRTFGSKRNEVMEGWTKLHNEELHDFYSVPSIIRIIKSRKMRWARHVWGRKGTCIGYWLESQK